MATESILSVMNVKVLTVAAVFLIAGIQSAPAQTSIPPAAPPRVFTMNPAALVQLKTHPAPEAHWMVIHDADRALKTPPQTVTAKTAVPPSGDKHDYMSMGRYWWPNPATPDHLPYIRRDGESNPEIANIRDHEALTRTAEDAQALALGYYLTGDARYAEHATLLLRAFFLDPATAMNPNLEYAQAIPGKNTGRGAGVLDARGFAFVIDAVGLLQGSGANDPKAWTAGDDAALHQWFAKYYVWLTGSKNGKDEAAAPNNHGSWDAVQRASIAQFLGKKDDVRAIAQQTQDHRIPDQFDAKGMQKYELARTNSFSYSAFNLEALTELANIVADTGIDLYKPVPSASGGTTGLLTGIDALLPYDAKHPWPHEQISKGKEDSLCPALKAAAAHTHDPRYSEGQRRFACKITGESLLADPEH